eukprot:6475313-Pyramimonas_sp.AAC.1
MDPLTLLRRGQVNGSKKNGRATETTRGPEMSEKKTMGTRGCSEEVLEPKVARSPTTRTYRQTQVDNDIIMRTSMRHAP